jgi:hypothetical protein
MRTCPQISLVHLDRSLQGQLVHLDRSAVVLSAGPVSGRRALRAVFPSNLPYAIRILACAKYVLRVLPCGMKKLRKDKVTLFRIPAQTAAIMVETAEAKGQTPSQYLRHALGDALRRDCLQEPKVTPMEGTGA